MYLHKIQHLFKTRPFTMVGAALGLLAVFIWLVIGTFDTQNGYKAGVVSFNFLIILLILFVLQTKFKVNELDKNSSIFSLMSQVSLFISYIFATSYLTAQFLIKDINDLASIFVLGIIYLTGFYATYSALRENEECIRKLESR